MYGTTTNNLFRHLTQQNNIQGYIFRLYTIMVIEITLGYNYHWLYFEHHNMLTYPKEYHGYQRALISEDGN